MSAFATCFLRRFEILAVVLKGCGYTEVCCCVKLNVLICGKRESVTENYNC